MTNTKSRIYANLAVLALIIYAILIGVALSS